MCKNHVETKFARSFMACGSSFRCSSSAVWLISREDGLFGYTFPLRGSSTRSAAVDAQANRLLMMRP